MLFGLVLQYSVKIALRLYIFSESEAISSNFCSIYTPFVKLLLIPGFMCVFYNSYCQLYITKLRLSKGIIDFMNEEEFKKQLGLNIKSIRVKRSYNQKELADFSRLSRESISKIERGEQNFTISSIFAIAKALNVDIFKLLEFENNL